MQNISILFYTNNLVSPRILEESLKGAMKQAQDNDCELIVTSHFPLTVDFESVNLITEPYYLKEFDPENQKHKASDIYDYIVKELKVEANCDHIKSYVVGKLPYSHESIFKQILFSLEKCSSDNVVLMEHDCFYPKEYIKSVKKCLIEYQYEFAYCSFANCFLNENGFFDISFRKFLLSTCVGKTKLMQRIFTDKLQLFQEKKRYKFEPVLDIEPSPNNYADNVIVTKHLCMDKFLDGPVLDIRHQLNSSANILIRDGNYSQHNSYWGDAKKFIDMIQDISVKRKNIQRWCYGTALQDY